MIHNCKRGAKDTKGTVKFIVQKYNAMAKKGKQNNNSTQDRT